MSALWKYVWELNRQVGLLELANARDDAAACVLCGSSHIGRRAWLRQDRNRLEHEVAFDDAIAANDPGRMEDLWRSTTRIRMRTRVGWFLRRFSRAPHWIDAFRPAALADARDQHIYNTVAPLLINAEAAHKRLLEAYEHQGDGEFFRSAGFDFRDAKNEHRAAIAILESYLPVEPLTPDEEKQKFCFEEWQRYRSLKEINAALKRHPEWEHYPDYKAVRGPIKAWGKRIGIEPRRGQPGRRKRAI